MDCVAVARAQGWGTEVLDQIRAAHFIEVCRESEAPVLAHVGEICNGSFTLEIALDRISVLLSVSPPRGGCPVTRANVQRGWPRWASSMAWMMAASRRPSPGVPAS
jgi:hypothetical protein